METEHFLKVPVGYTLVHPDANTGNGSETAMDKYTASIELSNACRQFYKSRVEAAHCIKTRWARSQTSGTPATTNDNDRPANAAATTTTTATATTTSTTDNNRPRRQRNSIDEAMDKLRTEMTSLMEQDLSLMRQLLTLNETIEELKWQRRYYRRRSGPRSSAPHHSHQHRHNSNNHHHPHDGDDDEYCSSYDDLSNSDCSISDTEMLYDSEDDVRTPTATPTPTNATTTTTLLNRSLHGSSSTTTTSSSSSSSSSSSNASHNTTLITATTTTSSNAATATTTCKKSSSSVSPPSSSPSSSTSSSSSSSTTTSADNQKLPGGLAGKVYRSERNSFDSGIHEHSSEEEGAVA